MKNLLRHPRAEDHIRQELSICGVPIVTILPEDQSDVPTNICGKLGAFVFLRISEGYLVQGNVPLEIAQELYACPFVDDILAMGRYASHITLEEIASWVTPEGKLLVDLKEKHIFDSLIRAKSITQEEVNDIFLFADPANFSTLGQRCIPLYIIDSQEGLNFFLNTLRKHRLV